MYTRDDITDGFWLPKINYVVLERSATACNRKMACIFKEYVEVCGSRILPTSRFDNETGALFLFLFLIFFFFEQTLKLSFLIFSLFFFFSLVFFFFFIYNIILRVVCVRRPVVSATG